jgi:hypothetical protein
LPTRSLWHDHGGVDLLEEFFDLDDERAEDDMIPMRNDLDIIGNRP